MKICILGDAGSIHLRRMGRGLADRGHRVHVVSHKPAEVPGASVEKFLVPPFGLQYPARWHGRREMYLRRLLRKHDIVHVNFLHDWGMTEEIAAAGRLVVSPWGSDLVKPPDLEAYPDGVLAQRRELLRMADRVIVYGRWFTHVVAEFAQLSREKIASVPLGVDLEFFRPRTDVESDACVVGFFKGFKPVYGPTTLVRAIPSVLSAVPGAQFEFVGNGPLRLECQALASSLGVAHAIQWLDHQPDERMPETISRWKLSAIPSYSESFCVSALESSAMEVPVVASRVGGLVDTVCDGTTGLLVPPGDPEALAQAIVELLWDEDRRRRLGVAGRDWVRRNYEWSHCLDRLIEVYEAVLGQGKVASESARSVGEVSGLEKRDWNAAGTSVHSIAVMEEA